MTKLLVMLSVAVRRIRRIRVQVLVIFRARGISFARPVAPPPEVSIANHACVEGRIGLARVVKEIQEMHRHHRLTL